MKPFQGRDQPRDRRWEVGSGVENQNPRKTGAVYPAAPSGGVFVHVGILGHGVQAHAQSNLGDLNVLPGHLENTVVQVIVQGFEE